MPKSKEEKRLILRNDEVLEALLTEFVESTIQCVHCNLRTKEVCNHGVCRDCHKDDHCIGCRGKSWNRIKFFPPRVLGASNG